MQTKNRTKLNSIVEELSETKLEQEVVFLQKDIVPPSRETVSYILETIKAIVFPGFFGEDSAVRTSQYAIGVNIDLLYSLLNIQIARALEYEGDNSITNISENAEEKTMSFLEALPEIKSILYTDVQAIYDNDPAVVSYGEIITCYPVVQAMIHYRMAHQLLKLGVPVLPRIITELAHSATGIDIHPGASIGKYFAIDHGTGVVIGETCVIGNHVTLYQGVTLGAKNFTLDSSGHPLNIARHPIIEDNVTVYSNSSILGRITIGHHSIIGGNVWLTHEVAPYSRIIQGKAQSMSFSDGLGI